MDCRLKTNHNRSDVQCRLRIKLNAGPRLLPLYRCAMLRFLLMRAIAVTVNRYSLTYATFSSTRGWDIPANWSANFHSELQYDQATVLNS